MRGPVQLALVGFSAAFADSFLLFKLKLLKLSTKFSYNGRKPKPRVFNFYIRKSLLRSVEQIYTSGTIL